MAKILGIIAMIIAVRVLDTIIVQFNDYMVKPDIIARNPYLQGDQGSLFKPVLLALIALGGLYSVKLGSIEIAAIFGAGSGLSEIASMMGGAKGAMRMSKRAGGAVVGAGASTAG